MDDSTLLRGSGRMAPSTKQFMGEETAEYDGAEFVIMPVPHEGNVSWHGGTAKGPEAVLAASSELEFYDFHTKVNVSKFKYVTIDPVAFDGIGDAASRIFTDGKIPIFIGGDHSISIPILAQLPQDISILHIDAHMDMRAEYLGNKMSHACALYSASASHNVVHTGIRSGGEVDIENAERFGNRIIDFWRVDDILGALGDDVYITFDVDALDPSIMPATGTPEPGGLNWDEANRIIESVCRKKSVVGLDFVELSPREGMHHCDSLVAKLIMRSIIYCSL